MLIYKFRILFMFELRKSLPSIKSLPTNMPPPPSQDLLRQSLPLPSTSNHKLFSCFLNQCIHPETKLTIFLSAGETGII